MRNFSMLRHNIKIDFTDLTDLKLVEAGITKDTRLVWIETPTNPTLKIIDIAAVCKIAKKFKDLIVVADNTFATPYLQ